MPRILYVLQFRGRVTVDDRGLGVVRTTAFAPSCTVTTRIGPDGIYGAVEPVPGERATFESEITVNGASRPRGIATVTVGTAGHRLHLTLLGSLDLDDGSPLIARRSPNQRRGARQRERRRG